MNINITQKQITDIRRGLIIAMNFADDTGNSADIKLSNSLEEIEIWLSGLTGDKHNWKKRMTELYVGDSFDDKSEHYGSIRAMRHKLRSEGYDFTFKIGKGLITVKRIEYERKNS
jgi:hypothetical protein